MLHLKIKLATSPKIKKILLATTPKLSVQSNCRHLRHQDEPDDTVFAEIDQAVYVIQGKIQAVKYTNTPKIYTHVFLVRRYKTFNLLPLNRF